MNASADWHVALALPRFGLMQSPTVSYVAVGQNCLMSPAHSLATQMTFDRIVEQPTERSPAATCACKQARTRPPPGLTPAHRDWISEAQSRCVANNPNPSCALAPQEPVSSIAAPSATAQNVVFMFAPFSWMTNTLLPQYIPVIFVFFHHLGVNESKGLPIWWLTKLGRQVTVLDHKETRRLCTSLDTKKDVHRHLIRTAPNEA